MKQFTFLNGRRRNAPKPEWENRKKLSPEKMMQLKLLDDLLCSGEETAERLVLEADLENFRLDDLKNLAIDDENSDDDLNNKDKEINDHDDNKPVTRVRLRDCKWLGPVGGYHKDIPEKELQHLRYKMAAKLAIEDLEIKNNSKYKLEKIISGISRFARGYTTILNLKIKDEHGKSCVYEARIYSQVSGLLGRSELYISGKLTYDDVGGATTIEI